MIFLTLTWVKRLFSSSVNFHHITKIHQKLGTCIFAKLSSLFCFSNNNLSRKSSCFSGFLINSFLNKNYQNWRTDCNINMKLSSLPKPDKRNARNVTMTSCGNYNIIVVFVIFSQVVAIQIGSRQMMDDLKVFINIPPSCNKYG